MRIALLVGGLAVAGTMLACGGGSSYTPTPIDVPTATLTVLPTNHPTGVSTPEPTPDATANARRTGIPEVDAVIDAVLSGNADELRNVTAFQSMACTATPVGIGPFYCDDGEPDRTVSEVLPVAQCEGYYIRKERLTLADPTLALYTAFRAESGYSIVFSRIVNKNFWSVAVNIENAKVTSLNYGCGDSPGDMVANVEPSDVVLTSSCRRLSKA